MNRQKLVLYAVDHDEIYQQLALFSIRSLRARSPAIPVRVCVFGDMKARLRRNFDELEAEVKCLPPAPPLLNTGLKWLALPHALDYRRVLFLDADTYLFGPPEAVFDSHERRDFYGAVETATEGDEWRGKRLIPMRVKRAGLKRLRRRYQAEDFPVFSSSCMLFNHGAHRRVVERLPVFHELFFGFHSRSIEYPCTLPYIAEEICGSIILGLRPALTYSAWGQRAYTNFNRWWSSDLKDPGLVMHIGNGHTIQFMERFELLSDKARFMKLYQRRYKRTSDFIHTL